MTEHKSAIPIEEKEANVGVTQHPWSKIVKDYLSQKIKYAHNSIRNPQYPVKQQNQPVSKGTDADRVQFTVIGDRVTKEFIFCSHLVRGLHKYRWKNFDVPIVRGVSTIEWPLIWNDLKIRFGSMANCLLTSVAVFRNDQIIGGENELKQLVEKQYIYHLCLDYNNEGVAEFSRFIRSSGRPTAYMHVSIDDVHVGTLIFMLYADVVPYTCENFLRLCKEKRGGYGGTPVHRIVKDGWIQCGGFTLGSTPLTCENFIIPLDKRGVLAMANDGRDIDCSTQFFVLLQPAPWMNQKYVAFGQLIEGAATLKKIERATTWYESPTSKIILYRCGILNLECQDIMINKGANQYIDGHIEDLTNLADRLWEAPLEGRDVIILVSAENQRWVHIVCIQHNAERNHVCLKLCYAHIPSRNLADILEQVFLSAQLREVERLREQDGEGAEGSPEDDAIRPTQRFKKEDIQKQIERNQEDQRSNVEDNQDFDVDEYVYEPEEDDYNHQSLHPGSLVVKPARPYYIPLTDIPYPGDVESDFDLKRLLQGKYCLESDLEKDVDKISTGATRFPSELLYNLETEMLGSDAENNMETEMDEELNMYLKEKVDRVSFAGGVVKSIAKKGDTKFNLFDDISVSDSRRVSHINDEKLRKIRLASVDIREQEERLASGRVAINAPQQLAGKIKRRQTGFVRQKDLENIRIIKDSEEDNDDDDDDDDNDDDSDSKTVRLNPIDVLEVEKTQSHPTYMSQRRPTGFIRPADFAKFISNYNDDDDDDDDDNDDNDDDYEMVSGTVNKGTDIEIKPFFRPSEDIALDDDVDDNIKPSVLTRLFKQVNMDFIPGHGPTLKSYRPLAEMQQRKNTLLTYSPIHRLQSNESTRAKYTRSVKPKDTPDDQKTLELQHGKKITRKISSDYVKTIDQDQKCENSLRRVEYAKTRPTISVAEYRLKNRLYQEGLRHMSNQVNTVMMPNVDFDIRPSTADFQCIKDARRSTLPEIIFPVK